MDNNQALVGLFQKPINDSLFLSLFIGLICLDAFPQLKTICPAWCSKYPLLFLQILILISYLCGLINFSSFAMNKSGNPENILFVIYLNNNYKRFFKLNFKF